MVGMRPWSPFFQGCTLPLMAKRKDPPTRRSTPRPVESGQPSEEYQRFESLMKRLVQVPKKVIAEREAKRRSA